MITLLFTALLPGMAIADMTSGVSRIRNRLQRHRPTAAGQHMLASQPGHGRP
ncbi:MAG: hypothetical protein QM586_13190 [Xenophilus sp.]